MKSDVRGEMWEWATSRSNIVSDIVLKSRIPTVVGSVGGEKGKPERPGVRVCLRPLNTLRPSMRKSSTQNLFFFFP